MGKELDRYQALALPGTRVLPIELARCTPRIGKSRLFFKRGKLVTIDWKQVFSYRNFLVSFLVDGQILLMTEYLCHPTFLICSVVTRSGWLMNVLRDEYGVEN